MQTTLPPVPAFLKPAPEQIREPSQFEDFAPIVFGNVEIGVARHRAAGRYYVRTWAREYGETFPAAALALAAQLEIAAAGLRELAEQADKQA